MQAGATFSRVGTAYAYHQSKAGRSEGCIVLSRGELLLRPLICAEIHVPRGGHVTHRFLAHGSLRPSARPP